MYQWAMWEPARHSRDSSPDVRKYDHQNATRYNQFTKNLARVPAAKNAWEKFKARVNPPRKSKIVK